MPDWLDKLQHALDQHGGAFGLVEVRDPAHLAGARQTGFVWTRQPGVVCLAADRRYFAMARDNPDVVAILAPPAVAAGEVVPGKSVIVAAAADQAYHHLHLLQAPPEAGAEPELDPTAQVDASAALRGAVRVGAGVRIGPRVVIEGPADIGAGARIDAGAILGCDGLYTKDVLGERVHIPHFGGVDIGPRAHVHGGAVIVRSAVRGEATRIGAGAHVGVLTNIGHDVEVGEAATISSNCVVAGRARIGARCWIGASVSISNAVSIGQGARVRIGAVVVQDVPAGGEVSGNFAQPHARNIKRYLRELRDGA